MSATDLPVSGLLHEETQVHDHGVDLTATEVYEIDGPGRVDFGGGELEPAGVHPHERHWRNEDDDYQWWRLEAGQFLIEYNESLDSDGLVLIQPRQALVERGAFHPTVRSRELSRMPISVGGAGILLKENARVSTVVSRQR